MVWSGHHMVDPSEIDTRFAMESGMAYMASIFTEPSEEAQQKVEEVMKMLDDLPPMEADFIELFFFKGFKQTDIASIFAVSQPTVCYRLKRAASRISFLLQMPTIQVMRLEGILREVLEEEQDVQIMLLMRETHCQSEVAKRLGVSQGLVRHRFIRSTNRLRRYPDLDSYVQLYEFLAANLNILREVRRPLGEHPVTYVID